MENLPYESQYKNNFIKKAEFGLDVFCPDDDGTVENDEYKQVFGAAESYLNRGGASQVDRSPYYNLRNFKTIVQRNQEAKIQTTWGKLASAFFLLHWYALRILRAPWRKSYTKVKAYSGSYHHVIGVNLPRDMAEELMGKMGFIYMRQRQTFFFHQESLSSPGSGTWQEALMTVGMDYFLVHVRCSLGSTEMGRSMEIDLLLLPNTLSAKHTSTIPERESRASRYDTWSSQSKRQQTGAFQPFGTKKTTQVNSAPAAIMEKNPGFSTVPTRNVRSGYTDDRENRVERLPTDYYVGLPTKPQSVSPSEPYGHKIPAQAKLEAGRRYKAPKYMTQISDEDLYGPNSVSELSLHGIRYPPRDAPFANSDFGKDTIRRVNQGIHSMLADDMRQRNEAPDRGYVQFMPIGAEKPLGPRRSVPTPQASHSTPSYLNMDPSSHTSESIASSSGYVYVQPPKRDKQRPQRPERSPSMSSHIYQQIDDAGIRSPGD